MKATVHDTITGRFVSKVKALLDPKGTVTVSSRQFTKEQLRYIYSALDAQTGSSRNAELRTKLLAKIDGMLG